MLCDYADGVDGAEGGLDRGEGDHDADDGAVRIADEETLFEVVVTLLVGKDGEMRKIDGWDDEGDEGGLAVVFGVGEDGEVSL